MFHVQISIEVPTMHGLTALDFCRRHGLADRAFIPRSNITFNVDVSEGIARRFGDLFKDRAAVSSTLGYDVLFKGDLEDDPATRAVQMTDISDERQQELAMLALRFPCK